MHVYLGTPLCELVGGQNNDIWEGDVWDTNCPNFLNTSLHYGCMTHSHCSAF